ncbi:hypothetical protein [Methanobrevibacter sp.]
MIIKTLAISQIKKRVNLAENNQRKRKTSKVTRKSEYKMLIKRLALSKSS